MHDDDTADRFSATDLNRASWDERATLHGQDDVFYDTAGVLSGASSLFPLELDLAGHVDRRSLVHLQCHIGLDSISWARLGAHVTGVDFSAVAIDKARHLATAAAVPVDFAVADVCDLPTTLHEQFDLAVATYGIFSWIGDLDAWASNAAATLRPGGRLVVVDGHPLIQMLEQAEPLIVDFPYADSGPHHSHSETTYADANCPLKAGDTVQWAHSVGEILTAITRAGLHIIEVREPLSSDLNIRPDVLTENHDGRWGLNIWPYSLPVLIAFTATKTG